MSSLMAAFFAQVGIVTYRTITQGGTGAKVNGRTMRAPLPSTYTSVVLIYAALGLMPKSMEPLPGLVGWGLVVATFLNLFTPGSANNAAQSNAQLGNALTATPGFSVQQTKLPVQK